jgi:hypothetical protein
MDDDPAILALLAAFADDVEEGAQLMEIDAEEAAMEVLLDGDDDEDDGGGEEYDEDGDVDMLDAPDIDDQDPRGGDDDDDDEGPHTPHDPDLQGPEGPQGVRRGRDPDEPQPGRGVVDEDAYWEDEYGEGDATVIRLRPVPTGAADPIDQDDDDDDDDGDDAAGRFDDDSEDERDVEERESAGMVLPRFGSGVSRTVFTRELWRTICRMGTETTGLIKRVVREGQPLTADERHRIEVWIKYWTGYVVEFHFHGLGEVISTPTGPGGEMERISGTSVMMCELWRLKLVLNFSRLGQFRAYRICDSPFLVKWLLDSPGIPLDCPPKEPPEPKPKTDGGTVTQKQSDDYAEACSKYAIKLRLFQSKQRIAVTPVLKMRQSQVRVLVQFLSARMKLIPYCPDIRKLFDVLELKTAMFFCLSASGTELDDMDMRADLAKEVEVAEEARRNEFKRKVRDEYVEAVRFAAREQPDLEPVNEGGRYIINRDFIIFCSSYWYAITRAFYMLEAMPRMNLEHSANPATYLPEGAVARMEAWARRAATNQGDNFQDRLAEAADDAMRYPGDDAWMDYKNPDESSNVEVVLRKLRGVAYYDEYHTQLSLSPEVIMNQVNSSWLSTTFVLLLFDRYMNTYKGVNWRSGYVIENAFLDEEDTYSKWTTTTEPLLVNVFSNYWLLFKGKVLPIDNIYTSLCIWMFMLRKVSESVGVWVVGGWVSEESPEICARDIDDATCF